jgi:2-keto-3-deoxy-L-fuconate dehydrogenase
MQNLLEGKRVLVTQAAEFMGPALCEVFASQGAEVVASDQPLADPRRQRVSSPDAATIDVLVVNLALRAPDTPAADVTDDEWTRVFAALVDPLPRLVRAVLPQMDRPPLRARCW